MAGAAIVVVAAAAALAVGLNQARQRTSCHASGGHRRVPAGGTAMGGTTVTITGTGLAGATGVRFGAIAAGSPPIRVRRSP